VVMRDTSSKSLRDVMAKVAECATPSTTLQDVARKMKTLDVGTLPVCDNDRLVGTLLTGTSPRRRSTEGKSERTMEGDGGGRCKAIICIGGLSEAGPLRVGSGAAWRRAAEGAIVHQGGYEGGGMPVHDGVVDFSSGKFATWSSLPPPAAAPPSLAILDVLVILANLGVRARPAARAPRRRFRSVSILGHI
jgi:hypothetical protein